MSGFARAASSDLDNPLLEIRGDGEDIERVPANGLTLSGRSSLGLPLLTAQETLQFCGELLA
jgi:hypothetical protein